MATDVDNNKHADNDIVIIGTYKDDATDNGHTVNNYKGLRMYAIAGLHEFVAQKVVQTLKPSSTLLDLAAGSGAMSLRLHDLGFQVTATDIVPDNFRLHDRMPFVSANLNKDFSREISPRYDAVMAVEIIEHIENPRHFLRECYALLKPGGVLALSTPNLDSPVSKAMYARFGTFQAFTDADYKNSGHITPVGPWYLSHCVRETGFETLWKGTYGDPYRVTEDGWIKLKLFAKFLRLFSTAKPEAEGEILVLILRKPS